MPHDTTLSEHIFCGARPCGEVHKANPQGRPLTSRLQGQETTTRPRLSEVALNVPRVGRYVC
ncbi:MAG: hypothetical protein AAFS10_23945, partial [Myxococcota bacterium]